MRARPRILYLCTGNRCRSQMAEGWTRHLHDDRFEAFSAGLEAQGLDPRAVQVMAEVGIDIGHQRSQHVDELAGLRFDAVVTVCGHTHAHCPVLRGAPRVLHQGFGDLARLTRRLDDEEAILAVYRQVRDSIGAWVTDLRAHLAAGGIDSCRGKEST